MPARARTIAVSASLLLTVGASLARADGSGEEIVVEVVVPGGTVELDGRSLAGPASGTVADSLPESVGNGASGVGAAVSLPVSSLSTVAFPGIDESIDLAPLGAAVGSVGIATDEGAAGRVRADLLSTAEENFASLFGAPTNLHDWWEHTSDVGNYGQCYQPTPVPPVPSAEKLPLWPAGLYDWILREYPAVTRWADRFVDYAIQCGAWSVFWNADQIAAGAFPTLLSGGRKAVQQVDSASDVAIGLQDPGLPVIRVKVAPIASNRIDSPIVGVRIGISHDRIAAVLPRIADRFDADRPDPPIPSGAAARSPETDPFQSGVVSAGFEAWQGAPPLPEPPVTFDAVPVAPSALDPASDSRDAAGSIPGMFWLPFAALAGLLLIIPQLHRLRANHALLELELRKRIYERVAESGDGVSAGALARALGVSRLTARYHLQLLQSHGLVATQRVGNRILFFRNGGGRSPEERRANCALARPAARRIVDVVRRQQDLTLRELAKRAGLTLSTTYWHVNRLEREGVLFTHRRSRSILFQLTPVAVAILPHGIESAADA